MHTTDIDIVRWHGCYDAGWRDLIVPGAFAHPAKMGRGLVARIFDELFARGALSRGSVVVDPFGGIGTTAIEGASRGVQVVCCELEPKFVALAIENFLLHKRDWEHMGRPQPRVVLGDSRKLRQHVGPVLAECVVSSPPYSEGLGHGGGSAPIAHDTKGTAQAMRDGYGDTPGQLGEMPTGAIDAVISSPPYAEIASGSGGLNTKPAKDGQQGGRSASSPSQDTDARYGESDGQLARMPKGEVNVILSSPPYADGCTRQGKDSYPNRLEGTTQSVALVSYGDTPWQLGEMPVGDGVDAIVGSPPFVENRASAHGSSEHAPSNQLLAKTANGGMAFIGKDYGSSAGQLGEMPAGAGVDAIVSSPPFTQGYAGGGGINRVGYRKDGVTDDKVGERTYQGTAADRVPGNLETMPLGAVADALVSSPPYEGSLAASTDGIDWRAAKRTDNQGGGHQAPGASAVAAYPATEGNVGNATGETFWSAARDIVREAYAVLRPGGTAVWVVKAFVRDKQLVDFPGDWRKLCESVGFVTETEVHAMLVHEETKSHLFDGEVVKRRERKSFFRRLAEKKGSPRIDWETVYFMRKPEAPCHAE